MKFLHISDLHLGKSIYGMSMIENKDQPDWVEKFIRLCRTEKPDAVVIAGDIYDRGAPSGAAVELLDHMLTELEEMDLPVMLIAGNHDSGQRLSFGHKLLAKQNIHIAGTAKKEMEHVTLNDEYGPITFWLMPYVFPEQVSMLLGDDSIHGYDDAVRRLLKEQKIDFSKRNVLVAHQNVVANGKEVERGGSESMAGGVGEVDFTAFDGFDYVALGHIHSAYPVGRKTVRYSGTPLCYHFDETRQPVKGPLMVELKQKGEEPEIALKAIEPLHRMRAMKGTYRDIYGMLEDDPGREEYISISIEDRRINPVIAGSLRNLLTERGSVLMELISSFSDYTKVSSAAKADRIAQRPVEDLFADLFTERNNRVPPDDREYLLMKYVGEMVRNSDVEEPADEKDAERVIRYAMKLGGEKDETT